MSKLLETSGVKHIVNGRYRLQWLVDDKNSTDTEISWKYHANYSSREDAEEHLNEYVKPGWPDVKWEIIDTLRK